MAGNDRRRGAAPHCRAAGRRAPSPAGTRAAPYAIDVQRETCVIDKCWLNYGLL